MGSLPSPPPTPPTSPGNSAAGYRIFASFYMKVPCTPNANISNWIECYNPIDDTWTYVSSIPGLAENHYLKGFAMVSLGHSIYIIGGQLRRKERACGSEGVHTFTDNDVEILSSVLRYDVRTNQWYNCKPLGVPRYDFACTICDDKIYVAGGQSTLASARGISSTEVYDPNSDNWTHLPYMNTLRYKCVGVTWQGKIHVVGGFAVRGDSDSPTPFITECSSAEVFDTINVKWDLMPKMWQLDIPPKQIVAVGGRLFSSGDCLTAWKGNIETYDEELKMWNMVDGSHHRTLASPVPKSDEDMNNWSLGQRLDLTMAPIGTYLYFLVVYRMVGESPKTMSMVHRFDTSATRDAWNDFGAMEEVGEKELCGHGCVVQLF